MVSLRENHKELVKNNKLISKSQQIFRSKKHHVFTEEVKRLHWVLTMKKRTWPIDSTETYAYGTNKDLAYNKNKLYVTI